MSRFAEFIFGDGVICVCPFDGAEVPDRDTVCLVEVDGILEFGRFLRVCIRSGYDDQFVVYGCFIRTADAEDRMKLTGNEEAVIRVRSQLMKWVDEGKKVVPSVRMRFSMRRECLHLLICVSESINFHPVFETLEKRFQTKVSARVVSAREMAGIIGGVGTCGCTLCCCNGVCRRTGVDMKMAKQQAVPLYDSVAVGICGKLKCCIGYEVKQAGEPVSDRVL